MTRPFLPILALILGLAIASQPATADPAAMARALALAGGKDWPAALSAAPAGIGRDIIEWQRLRASDGTLTDYESFLARNPDWPGLPLLREKGEEAVARSSQPDRVIAYFNGTKPETGAGAVALVRALQVTGRQTEAEAEGMRAWASLPFAAAEEDAILALLPAALPLVHEVRLDRLLWEGRKAEAQRMIPRVSPGWAALARARIAIRDDAEGITALVNAVPADLAKDPGLAYERFVYRMKADRMDEALPLILDRSAAKTLGDPTAWADRRASLARILMRQGRAAEAYRLASQHGLTEGSDYADLEFLSGFIALRKLGDPATAATHFGHLQAGVSTPISLARAHYWLGRAAQAAGNADRAQAEYQTAARHQTAYYGLLAAETLGLSLDPVLLAETKAADWRQSSFATSTVLDAALLLSRAGDRTLSKRFFLHLGESLDATELDQLADLAFQIDEPHIAVLIGKAAAERGAILPRAYFPVPAFVPDGLPVSRALALAIARRESEFDPMARSPADARGLMQVLPGTAELVADKIGLAYSGDRLFTDPAYNVQIGSAYLAQMIEEFGPSIALIASGYNAGPGRPRRWITEFGDPRSPDVDIVDWVETIPFTETRTYVMRVVEGVVIYRAKLKGTPSPIRISSELKG